MYRHIGAALAATALTLTGATLAAAGAGPAQHDTLIESYDGTQALSAQENPCGRWAATLHEVRSGTYKIVQAPGGQIEGEFHVNGSVNGLIELTPENPALPTYTGDYREKINAVITGYDEERGDLARVAQYRLRVRLNGSDGSRLVLAMSGKTTTNANGHPVVERNSMTCS
jgi:hypothetical protein